MSRFTIKPSEGLGDTTVTVTAGNQQNRVDYSETHRFYIKGNEGIYDDCVITKTGVGYVPTENYIHPDIIEFPIEGGENILPIPDSFKTNSDILSWGMNSVLPSTFNPVISVDWGNGFVVLGKRGTDVTPDIGAIDAYPLKAKLSLGVSTFKTFQFKIKLNFGIGADTKYAEYTIKQIGIPTLSIDPKAITITPTTPGTVTVTSDGEWSVKEI